MTGPEHYSEAERLINVARDAGERSFAAEWCLRAAQVHATLALVAVTGEMP